MEVKKIKLKDGSLVFYDEAGDEIYSIPQDSLGDKMDDGDSEWINQLSEKSWATRSLLQEVADKIKEQFPDNDINWETTNKIISTQP